MTWFPRLKTNKEMGRVDLRENITRLDEYKYGKICDDCGNYACGCLCGECPDEWREQEQDEWA